jgi:hypothetical protein
VWPLIFGAERAARTKKRVGFGGAGVALLLIIGNIVLNPGSR